jgi:ATP-binding cassette subfamily B protein/subfamily B ATP-binding cassette protein MsbA
MRNFYRVIRLALRYRWTFAATVLSALAVGILWGANIGTIYPFAEVAIRGRTLQQWADDKIDEARRNDAEYGRRAEHLQGELASVPAAQARPLRKEIERLQAQRQVERAAEAKYAWIKPWIDRYVPHDPFQTLTLFIGVLLVLTLVKILFLMANTVMVSRLSNLGSLGLRRQFFRRTLNMDVATFNNDGTSDLMSRFTHDTEAVTGGLDALFGRVIREPLKMVVCLVGAAWICWQLLVLSLILAPIGSFLTRQLAMSLKRANRRAMEEMAQLYTTLEEAFRGIKVVKSFTMERRERRRFHYNAKTYYRKMMRIAFYDSLLHPLSEIMGIITISLALLAGAYLVLTGHTTLFGITMCSRPLEIESLTLFYAFLIGSADPMRKMSDIFTRIQRAAAASDRIYALLDRQPSIRDPQHPRRLGRHATDLVFEKVEFAYTPGRPVLRDINLRIQFGETIGVVGPSGCGKSTLANLIPRFADPTAGSIRLDGIPLRDVRLRALRGQVGLVTQEPLLFDDTVMNNIRYGSPRATEEQVIAAAKQAHAHWFIEHELTDAYETSLGPMGGQLSGGQRQRIALARAILRDPALLILDEATSQIDLESEQIIQRVLAHFTEGRTTVIVTHRLGLLALAHRIVVMQDGRIVDVGSHEDLLRRCEFYHRLYEIQFADLKETA